MDGTTQTFVRFWPDSGTWLWMALIFAKNNFINCTDHADIWRKNKEKIANCTESDYDLILIHYGWHLPGILRG